MMTHEISCATAAKLQSFDRRRFPVCGTILSGLRNDLDAMAAITLLSLAAAFGGGAPRTGRGWHSGNGSSVSVNVSGDIDSGGRGPTASSTPTLPSGTTLEGEAQESILRRQRQIVDVDIGAVSGDSSRRHRPSLLMSRCWCSPPPTRHPCRTTCRAPGVLRCPPTLSSIDSAASHRFASGTPALSDDQA